MPENIKVIVVARDLKMFTGSTQLANEIANHCGSVESGLVRRVLENNVETEVALEILTVALDTQNGVNSIFDNFDLTIKSGELMVHWLLNQVRKS